MLKKIISVLVCVALLLSFSACAKAKTYEYGPVSGGASASDKTEGNGGFVVKKGDYIYFINSSEATTATNELDATKNGAIMRAKADGSDVTTILPKLVANANGTGLYIFGDKIYFTSPCDEINSKGKVQNSYLDIMSVNLDGTGATKYATLGSTSYTMTFIEENGEVYLLFLKDGELSSMKLDGKTSKPTVTLTEITSYAFAENGVYVTTTENGVSTVSLVSGSGEKKELFNGSVDDVNYTLTIVKLDGGKLYYRKTDSVVTLEDSLCARDINNIGAEKKLLNNYTSSFVTTSYPSDGIIVSSTYLGTAFVSFDGEITQLRSSTTSSLIRVTDKYLYYGSTSSSVTTMYRYDISELLAGKASSEQFLVLSTTTDDEGETTTTYDGVYASNFSTIVIDDVLYYYSNAADVKLLTKFDGAKITTVGITD